MVFAVLLDHKATKALKKLDDTNRRRIKKALGDLAVDPWKVGEPLHPSDFWKVKSGDYRAIYEIDAERNRVVVLLIGHRKKVYDDFSKML